MGRPRAKSDRPADSRAEAAVGEFLDANFYPAVMPRLGCSWRRVDDAARQVAGVDVEVRLAGGLLLAVDEKSQVDYLASPLPTFVLELGFTGRDGRRQQGWFLNDELKTDAYLFVWPRADVAKRELSAARILRCECMTVPRAGLRRELEAAGWGRERLARLERAVCEGPWPHSHSVPFSQAENGAAEGAAPRGPAECAGPDVDGVKVSRSPRLAENPVNLVVKKEFLLRCATGHYDVRPGRVDVLGVPKALAGLSPLAPTSS